MHTCMRMFDFSCSQCPNRDPTTTSITTVLLRMHKLTTSMHTFESSRRLLVFRNMRSRVVDKTFRLFEYCSSCETDQWACVLTITRVSGG